LARVVIDLSGRPSLSYHVVPSRLEIGGMDADLFREFFQALTHRGRLALHIDLIRGVNAHHQMEAVFKAFGLALAAAVARTADTGVPSTKGVL
jgi:imidazoleglycerol-phosphate dehydratase